MTSRTEAIAETLFNAEHPEVGWRDANDWWRRWAYERADLVEAALTDLEEVDE